MFEELKPCPFCGGKAIFHVTTNKMSHYGVGFEFNIICTRCGTRSPKCYEMEISLDNNGEVKTGSDNREKAVKDWNRRAAVNER